VTRAAPSVAWLLAVCCALTVLGAGGCARRDRESGETAEEQARGEERNLPFVPLGLRLTQDDIDYAQELAGRVHRRAFPKELVGDESNASLFIHLAATSSSPEVVVAALDAMRTTFSSGHRPKPREPRGGDDYGTVVALRLQSEHAEILAAAIEAARPALSGARPFAPMIDELCVVAQSHPNVGARVRALKALGEVPHYQKHDSIVRALLGVLESDGPAVLATALDYAARHQARELLEQDAFREHAIRLLRHSDPAVRGRAARLAALLAPKDVGVVAPVVTMLHDAQPCARAFAALALVDIHDPSAIHALLPLVADMANARYRIRYKDLDGRNAQVAYFTKRRSLVHDRIVQAISALSEQTAVPFVPPPELAASPAQGRQRTAEAARQWYAANQSQLPPPWPVGDAGAPGPGRD